ncbi:MAG TPA: peptide-methionine (R)-S-oxide reductase MsrB [Candidatus Baltobacteraceae bacterium]|jgi:peptide-methionine (R)-S-oxide reductase|nr:peptide-methionine (R)-S-oxide reductase MsrB [Candidatus Baltobacteraceae bacterium]
MLQRIVSRGQLLAMLGVTCAACAMSLASSAAETPSTRDRVRLSDAEWRKRLTPAQYAVLRQSSTEYPGSSPLENEKRVGTYRCAGCALPLFSSATKFDSGTGWPSFFAPLPHAVETSVDRELGYTRTEVHCRRCEGHLGHVFDDGPPPTHLRYCMNGVALTFVPR